MSLNMLIEFGEAFDFTGADFTRWCTKAGFRTTEILHLAGPASADRLQVDDDSNSDTDIGSPWRWRQTSTPRLRCEEVSPEDFRRETP